jgi:hypothetical protein
VKCNQCDNNLITANFDGNLPFQPDSEPCESGVIEEVDVDIEESVHLGILWCETHGIQSIWVIEPKSNTAPTGQVTLDPSAQAEVDALSERLANNHRKLSGSCR